MITLVLAITAGTGGALVSYFGGDFGVGWSVFIGLALFVAVQGGCSVFFMKRIKADMERVQGIMAAAQKAVEAKTRQWAIRPPGSIKEAQRIVQGDMAAAARRALAETEKLMKYKPWVLMVARQVATAKFHLNWMLKDFKAVDELMPQALFLEPTSLSMKMARMQMTGAGLDEIEKVYRKAVARARYNANVLPAACWSWILVKRAEAETDEKAREALVDRAFKALGEALKNSDNETLKRNHEALMNNRLYHFNNSGLADQWYALHLEEPKIKVQRRR